MNTEPGQIHQYPPEEVYFLLHSRPEGLTTREVEERLQHVGSNSFEVPDRWKTLRSLLRQFTNFFTLLLLLSAVICFSAHGINPKERMDILGWALAVVASLNAIFSFIQEFRAERAMEALQRFLPHQVEVEREGVVMKVDVTQIAPGDLLLLGEGDKICADARIVAAEGLLVSNAPLTGEATPLHLHNGPSERGFIESENIVFAGCSVIRGVGKAVVFATGLRTEFGKLANLSQGIRRERSPLERETARMVRILTLIATAMGLIFFLYGVISGRPLWVNLVFMMGIIVANVPEGLLPTFTLSLAMGSLRMAKKNVLVKSLNAVEALGAVHVICSDKTGTLTENRLSITAIADPQSGAELGDEQGRTLLALALAASEVRKIDNGFSGDPLDVAIARKFVELEGDLHAVQQGIEQYFPFDVEKRRSGGIIRYENDLFFVVKGALEVVAPLVSGIETRSSTTSPIPASKDELESVQCQLHAMASVGLRVIAVAAKKLDVMVDTPDQNVLENELQLMAFLGIEDPLRQEVPAAIAKCHKAGLDVLLITGDHPDTAQAIARKSGITGQGDDTAPVIHGSELKQLTEKALRNKIKEGAKIFARTTPGQKMKIVAALQSMDRVVAMTGDGVNDAPALKAADVGIAMGQQGTDVARESAQIVLLDDNFASIVAGIEEGRTVFENIKKFTNYVLVSNGPEILPYILYILFPVPLALNVIHILSIDLGTDIIPSMALGQEPPDEEVMSRPPRQAGQGLLSLRLILHSYLFLGLLEGVWSLTLFFYVLISGGWHWGMELSSGDPLLRSATGITLSTILLMQVGNLLGRRYRIRSGLDRGIVKNRLMLAGIMIQVGFSWAILYAPPVQHILNTGPVPLSLYLGAWFGILLIFGSDYLRKRLFATVPR